MWNEHAVAVERQHGEAVIICEGPFAAVLATLQPVKAGRFSGIRVLLPDRRAIPNSLAGKSLRALVDDPSRPRVAPLPLLPAAILVDAPFALPA